MSFGGQPSLTLFRDNGSAIQRWHPFTKLSIILFVVSSVYCSPGFLSYGAIGVLPLQTLVIDIFFVVSGGLLLAYSGTVIPAFHAALKLLLPLAVFLFPIHGLFYAENATLLFTIGKLNFFLEGFQFALRLLLQLSALLIYSLLFVYTTHPAELIAAIAGNGESAVRLSFAYLIGSPLLLLPAMRERVKAIQVAQRARGFETGGSILKRCLSLIPLVVPLVVGALSSIEQRAIVLELRGFTAPGSKTFLRTPYDSNFQKILRRTILLTCAAFVLLRCIL